MGLDLDPRAGAVPALSEWGRHRVWLDFGWGMSCELKGGAQTGLEEPVEAERLLGLSLWAHSVQGQPQSPGADAHGL